MATALPTTKDRVPRHTAEEINERPRRQTARRVRALAAHPQDIARRLDELGAEWDIERAIEATLRVSRWSASGLGIS